MYTVEMKASRDLVNYGIYKHKDKKAFIKWGMKKLKALKEMEGYEQENEERKR